MPTFLLAIIAALTVLEPAGTRSVQAVNASGSPVTLSGMKLLNTDAQPLVLLYAATNVVDAPLDQFTVTVFVFGSDGKLKARQVAPGRRELAVKETKYSSMVLDVGTIDPTDQLMAGVDQAQRVGSDDWWRADLRTIAEGAMAAQKPATPARR